MKINSYNSQLKSFIYMKSQLSIQNQNEKTKRRNIEHIMHVSFLQCLCIIIIYQMTCTHAKRISHFFPLWISVLLLLVFAPSASNGSQAPFIPLDTVHQAHSQYELNLILNQNRHHPIILVTVSNNRTRTAAVDILQKTHRQEKHAGFSVIVECDKWSWNLNHTLGVCELYWKHLRERNVGAIVEEEGVDSYFECRVYLPSGKKITEKGHSIMQSHYNQFIQDGSYFNYEYLSEMIRKNVPDFVTYVENDYELGEFLETNSEVIMKSKLPKLLYFDENLIAPFFLKKLSAVLTNRIEVAVTDDPPLAKKYSTSFDSLLILEYSFSQKGYKHRQIPFTDEDSALDEIFKDDKIARYMRIRKNRDILLDFEYNSEKVYEFQVKDQVSYLLTHARGIVIQFGQKKKSTKIQDNDDEDNVTTACKSLEEIAKKYSTLFNYVCYVGNEADFNVKGKQLYFILNSIEDKTKISESTNIIDLLPKKQSRQKVSTETEAQLCLRTAEITSRDPLFYYLHEKSQSDNLGIMGYLNSLPEMTSLLYFCHIYLPDEHMVKKFGLRINTMFTMMNSPDSASKGHLQKLEHTKISTFIEIKMFLREVAIKNMLQVYENRLINNNVPEVSTAQELTQYCFTKKCIIGLIATGRYRQPQEIDMLKELKLLYEEQYTFVWIDGVCHWDIAKQLKILKKKEKLIDRSYVFFYQEKDKAYRLWEQGKKFWDRKELEKWVKGLRGGLQVGSLRFGIDIEDRKCEKKKKEKQIGEEL